MWSSVESCNKNKKQPVKKEANTCTYTASGDMVCGVQTGLYGDSLILSKNANAKPTAISKATPSVGQNYREKFMNAK
jgi:hypothetical protein